jgi:hypothetical protein
MAVTVLNLDIALAARVSLHRVNNGKGQPKFHPQTRTQRGLSLDQGQEDVCELIIKKEGPSGCRIDGSHQSNTVARQHRRFEFFKLPLRDD